MFLDCTPKIAQNPPRHGYGVAVTDLDGDGCFEFLVAGYGCANLALKWDGGRLVDTADPVLADVVGEAVGVCAADVDGDGREEIYILNADKAGGRKRHPDRLLASFGPRWFDLLAQPESMATANRANGRSVACLDRQGRGRYGFVLAPQGGALKLIEMARRGRLFDAAEEAGLDLDGQCRSLLALPLVSGRMDLFVGNENGANFLFRNRGDGSFDEVAETLGVADTHQSARGAVALDADGNGLFDILCGNWKGSHRLYLQMAGGAFDDQAPDEMRAPSKLRTVIAADFDNDGYEEVLFNNFGQPNRLFGWRHDRWLPIEIGDAAEPDFFGTGAAVADIDRDGHLELLISHGEGAAQPLSFYRPIPNDNAWLRVMPLTPTGAPARGAVITVSAGGRTQRRAICAGSGYLCQMEPVAHFGLGDLGQVDQVEVRWPDGVAAVIDSPPLRRLLPVPHPPA
ncbi:MAG: CRTAC1 family protein [Azospirillum sp.]|nr:CRTAC1 family protein [Azospirillum sp.]